MASEDYMDYLFSNYTGESKTFWITVSKFVESVDDLMDIFIFIVSIIGILANTFHLLVLTQKSLKIHTINLFLTGIAFCDLSRMICAILITLPFFNMKYFQRSTPIECLGPQWYSTMIVMVFCSSTNTIVQQLSIWYGVTIAMLRALVVRYPLNPRINCLIHTRYGIRPFLTVTIIFIPFWIISYAEDHVQVYGIWTPPPQCSNFPPNYTTVDYFYETIPLFGQSFTDLYRSALVFEDAIEDCPCEDEAPDNISDNETGDSDGSETSNESIWIRLLELGLIEREVSHGVSMGMTKRTKETSARIAPARA